MTANGSKPRKVFSVGVMRTGGTSLMWMARAAVGIEAVFPNDGGETVGFIDAVQDVEYLQGLTPERVTSLRGIFGHFPLCAAAGFPDFRPVTILREPVSRACSMLKMMRTSDVDSDWDELFHSPLAQALLVNHQTRLLGLAAAEGLPAPNRAPVTIGPTHLERAIAALGEVEVLGLMPEFDRYVDEVFDLLGDRPAKRVRVNESLPVDVPGSLVDALRAANDADQELYAAAEQEWSRRHT